MNKPFNLDGKIAVVTGARQGLGKTFARSLAVAGATVSISWSGVVSGTDSGVTGSGGTVTFRSANVKKQTGPFTITVTNVTHATSSYNSSLNVETSDTAYY